jgi:DHA1 family tetracycline resistance protein-like MFS transporter
MASKRNPAIGFIFITLVIDVLGIGLIIPILPTLIRGFTGGDLSTASQYSGWLMASYAIMQFFFSPVLGGLSDQFGRRPIILASLFGFSIDYLVLANASLTLLLVHQHI